MRPSQETAGRFFTDSEIARLRNCEIKKNF
nr:MAG TPA: Phycobiliprotein ApcE, ApcE, phycocyanobilin attachment, TRANSFERASE [Caudoviricetes sp.]